MDPHPTLLAWLRRAHAGELGAALAYRGHALSLRHGPERARIWAILVEEIAHRRVAAMLLAQRDVRPDRLLVRRVARIGRVAGIACRFTGHLLPMLGAALAEWINVWEYGEMARVAKDDPDAAAFARDAAEVERGHAEWFLRAAARHRGMVGVIVGWLLTRGVRAEAPAQPCLSTSRAVLVTGST